MPWIIDFNGAFMSLGLKLDKSYDSTIATLLSLLFIIYANLSLPTYLRELGAKHAQRGLAVEIAGHLKPPGCLCHPPLATELDDFFHRYALAHAVFGEVEHAQIAPFRGDKRVAEDVGVMCVRARCARARGRACMCVCAGGAHLWSTSICPGPR